MCRLTQQLHISWWTTVQGAKPFQQCRCHAATVRNKNVVANLDHSSWGLKMPIGDCQNEWHNLNTLSCLKEDEMCFFSQVKGFLLLYFSTEFVCAFDISYHSFFIPPVTKFFWFVCFWLGGGGGGWWEDHRVYVFAFMCVCRPVCPGFVRMISSVPLSLF